MATFDVSQNMFSSIIFYRHNAPLIRTDLPPIVLPQASLYLINPAAPNGYLVETDPTFTDRKQWLSSDYLLQQLHADPQWMQKRLGDGFYEQRLVNEQIARLTGQRYLDGYHDDTEQYKALLDSGVRYAKQFHLTPGVGLTAQQMAELTTDMVWLVSQNVTLPSGKTLSVLVPQVYLVAGQVDVNKQGALISAQHIVGAADEVNNNGTIAGRDLVSLQSQNLTNQGLMIGRSVNLAAKQNLVNLGGEIQAVSNLTLLAGKELRAESTTTDNQDMQKNDRTFVFEQTRFDRLSAFKVTGNNGTLNLFSDGNLTLKGSRLKSAGEVNLAAQGNLNLDTLNTSTRQAFNHDANNYYRLNQQNEIGSQVEAKGNIILTGENLRARQAAIHSDAGDVALNAQKDIQLEAGQNREQLDSAVKVTSKGWTSKTTTLTQHSHDNLENQGSQVDGENVTLNAGNNLTVQGSAIVANQDLTATAKNISLTTAENRYSSFDNVQSKKSGLMGGGIGFSIGSQKQGLENTQRQQVQVGNQLGSLNGDVQLSAQNHYTQTAGQLSAAKGNVSIAAQSVDIQAGTNRYENAQKQTFEKKGFTVSLTSPALAALQATQRAAGNIRVLGDSQNSRINAMSAVNAGFAAYHAAQVIGSTANALQQAAASGDASSLIGIELGYGQQKAESESKENGTTAELSKINAGKNVSIQASGAGEQSNINIKGAQIGGKQGTSLTADNKINIEAAQETHSERSQNRSSGSNVGVALKFGGNGIVAGVSVGGNRGKGYGNGDDLTNIAGEIGDKNSRTSLSSGSDINLIGSQVKGKQINVTAQNLNIESLQDKSTYQGKQQNIAGSVTVGYGASVSGNFSKSNLNSDYASVNQQAGIFAGDNGYNINIGKNTDLKGALITSTQQAEDDGKNNLSTGTLSHSDIENHANYQGSSFGISGRAAANFDTPLKGGEAQSSKDATGLASTEVNQALGYGKVGDSQNSVTQSGINTKNINIHNDAKAANGIHTDITTDNAENQSGKLTNRFNQSAVQNELDLQRDTTMQFGQNMAEAGNLIAQQLGKAAFEKKQQAEVALNAAKEAVAKNDSETNRALEAQAQRDFKQAEAQAQQWETGGEQRRMIDSALNVITAALSGKPIGEVMAQGLSPTINHQIKLATEGNQPANLAAHALWGAMEAIFSQCCVEKFLFR